MDINTYRVLKNDGNIFIMQDPNVITQDGSPYIFAVFWYRQFNKFIFYHNPQVSHTPNKSEVKEYLTTFYSSPNKK